jgi:hypothetical protein
MNEVGKFEKWSILVCEYRRHGCGSIRLGQAGFNALHDIDKELAEKIVGTNQDPYYDDEKVDALIEFLSNEWKQEG